MARCAIGDDGGRQSRRASDSVERRSAADGESDGGAATVGGGVASTRLLIVPLVLLALALAPAIAEAESRVSGDFNGDGFDDLAVGVPFEDLGPVEDAGAVNVIYGSASRLTAAGSQFWHQDSPGIADVAEPGDGFGGSLAAGDFDGDGFDDLAIGVASEVLESADGRRDAGAANVIYGSASRLTAAGNQLWHLGRLPGRHQDRRPGIVDAFASSLAAGDFNGDGFDDLAVGAPFKDLGSAAAAGTVSLIYGSANRLTAGGNQLWHQERQGIAGVAEQGDLFGNALAAGDFDGDGFDDLAVAAWAEGLGPPTNAGAVHVIYGSASRLTATGNQLWHQDRPGIADVAERFDEFGNALAAGDFNGDGFDDLAVGVSQEDLEAERVLAGVVHVIYGSPGRLTTTGDQLWHQDRPGIVDEARADFFGDALAAGDFSGDGFDDLAVGAPAEDLEPTINAGAVNVIYGSASRLTATGNQLWHQDRPGIADMAEMDDHFGSELVAGGFDDAGFDDLAVGNVLEGLGPEGFTSEGAVNVIYGSASRLSADGDQFWHQDSPGIADVAEPGDLFGRF